MFERNLAGEVRKAYQRRFLSLFKLKRYPSLREGEAH